MKLKPIGDRILIRRAKEDDKTRGGIFIPDQAKEKPSRGTVLRVGGGVRLESGELRPLDVKEGDEVFFQKWCGWEAPLDGEELFICREADIFAIVEPEA